MSKIEGRFLEEEDMFLRKHNDWSIAQVAEAMGRTRASIINRRRKLHLPRRSWKGTVCKVCGKPRYEFSPNELCEDHYLEYYREAMKRGRERRQVLKSDKTG